MIVKADNGMEGALVSFPPVTSLGAGDCGVISYSRTNGSFFRIGAHSIIVTSASGEKCAFTLTVTDNEPPQLSELTLSAKRIWPASNRMKKVAVYYTSSDNAKNVINELSVQSNNNEPANKDFEVINKHMIRLKASRLPSGEPRIYTITVTSTDEAGNKTRRSTSIAVSKTMGLTYTSNVASSLANLED
jgi:hypothetical protein